MDFFKRLLTRIKLLLNVSNSVPQFFGFNSAAPRAFEPVTHWFWYRELWHFVGGVSWGFLAFGTGLLWFPLRYTILLIGLVFQCVKESFEDINDGQATTKTVIDVFAWTFGFAFSLLPVYYQPVPFITLFLIYWLVYRRYGDCRSKYDLADWRKAGIDY